MCCGSMKRIVNRWSVYGDFATILYARSLERRRETKWVGGASNRSILFTMTKERRNSCSVAKGGINRYKESRSRIDIWPLSLKKGATVF